VKDLHERNKGSNFALALKKRRFFTLKIIKNKVKFSALTECCFMKIIT